MSSYFVVKNFYVGFDKYATVGLAFLQLFFPLVDLTFYAGRYCRFKCSVTKKFGYLNKAVQNVHHFVF